MKNRKIFAIFAIIAMIALAACTTNTNKGNIWDNEKYSHDNVTYYGCPNSKRVKKLSIKKVISNIF